VILLSGSTSGRHFSKILSLEDTLLDYDKFTYLRTVIQYAEGKSILENFTEGEHTYDEAVKALKVRFDQKQQIYKARVK